MRVYKDKTFCNAKCANTFCPDMITNKVLSDAERWGGPDALISVADNSGACKDFLPLKQEIK